MICNYFRGGDADGKTGQSVGTGWTMPVFSIPALQREEYSAIYRFSALMTEPVRPAALQNAIDRVLPRFPSFSVRIRRGLFWYYLEPNTAPGPFLKADVANPCQPVRFREDNGWLVRFYYYRNRISLEVFHALSDGAGALIFFRTLLAEYLRQTGISVPAGNGVLDLEEPPRKEELEDAYARYAGRHALGLRRMPRPTPTPAPRSPFTLSMSPWALCPWGSSGRLPGAITPPSQNTSPPC